MSRMLRRGEAAGKWLVSGPPIIYLLLFFAVPALIMVLASFRTPGEFGGLAPLLDEAGKPDDTEAEDEDAEDCRAIP